MIAADELSYIVRGRQFDVALTRKVTRVFEKLPAKIRASIISIMEIYAEHGPRDLPNTQFRFESRLSVGDAARTNVAVHAFKDWQTRIYGAVIKIAGRPTFVCSEIDDSKKQNKADQECLRRAAQNLRPFLDA